MQIQTNNSDCFPFASEWGGAAFLSVLCQKDLANEGDFHAGKEIAVEGKTRVKIKGQMHSFAAYFHGLKRPHMICDIWPQWREFGERVRSGGRLGRKTERNTIKYVQLSGKVSICQVFVFFLVCWSHRKSCVCTRVCVCGGELWKWEETENTQDLSERGVQGRGWRNPAPPLNVQMQTTQTETSRWKVLGFCFFPSERAC